MLDRRRHLYPRGRIPIATAIALAEAGRHGETYFGAGKTQSGLVETEAAGGRGDKQVVTTAAKGERSCSCPRH